MFISASSLGHVEHESVSAIWSAAAVGALTMAYASYTIGLRNGQQRNNKEAKLSPPTLIASTNKTTTKADGGSTCPFSGRRLSSTPELTSLVASEMSRSDGSRNSTSDSNIMSCPFWGGHSSNATTTSTNNVPSNPVLKTYKLNISPKHKEIIKATLPAVAHAGQGFTEHFYKRLFKGTPWLKNIFNQTNQACGHQPKRLFNLIAMAAMTLLDSDGEVSGDMVEAVAQKHVALGVPAEGYAIVGSNILATIEELLTNDPTVLEAWGALYNELANVFIEREAEIVSSQIGWEGRRTFQLVSKTIQSDTITRFQFRPVDGQPVPAFRAGQYTTVWVKVPEGSAGIHGEYQEQPRHYTLALETEDNEEDTEAGHRTLSISVKRDGLISKMLHDAKIGTEFDLSAPVGCFDLRDAEQQSKWLSSGSNDDTTPVVLMSAGVGVTPVLAMLESLSEDRPVTWLHGSRNGNEHAYRDRVRQLAATRKGELVTRIWYSNPTEADGAAGGMESCPTLFNLSKYHFRGRMDLLTKTFDDDYKFPTNDILYLDNPQTQYYMCGPNGFMEDQRMALETLGVEASRIHSEGF